MILKLQYGKTVKKYSYLNLYWNLFMRVKKR